MPDDNPPVVFQKALLDPSSLDLFSATSSTKFTEEIHDRVDDQHLETPIIHESDSALSANKLTAERDQLEARFAAQSSKLGHRGCYREPDYRRHQIYPQWL